MDDYFDFLTLVEERFSVRSFTDEPILPDVLSRILRAGHAAPTGSNLQPQRIYVLKSEQALEKLKHCTPWHFDAPLALLVCADMEACWERPFDGQPTGMADAATVACYMMLQAAAEGVGCTWVNYIDPDALAAEYDLPGTHFPVCLLAMGYAAEDALPATGNLRKRPAQELIQYL